MNAVARSKYAARRQSDAGRVDRDDEVAAIPETRDRANNAEYAEHPEHRWDETTRPAEKGGGAEADKCEEDTSEDQGNLDVDAWL